MKKVSVLLMTFGLSVCVLAQSVKPAAEVPRQDTLIASDSDSLETAPSAACTTGPAGVPQAPAVADHTQQLTRRPAASLHSQGAVLPAGTAIYFKLEQPVSTRRNKVGDTFLARVSKPVVVQGQTVIAAGASLSGIVVNVSEPRRIAGHSSIRLRPESVIMPDGSELTINAAVVDTSDPRRYRVDDEGRIRGPEVKTLDKAEGVALAGTGAIAGTIIAGPEGLLIGAASGLAATGGHMLAKRHEMILPKGAEIIVELSTAASSSPAVVVAAAAKGIYQE